MGSDLLAKLFLYLQACIETQPLDYAWQGLLLIGKKRFTASTSAITCAISNILMAELGAKLIMQNAGRSSASASGVKKLI